MKKGVWEMSVCFAQRVFSLPIHRRTGAQIAGFSVCERSGDGNYTPKKQNWKGFFFFLKRWEIADELGFIRSWLVWELFRRRRLKLEITCVMKMIPLGGRERTSLVTHRYKWPLILDVEGRRRSIFSLLLPSSVPDKIHQNFRNYAFFSWTERLPILIFH